MLTQQVLQRVGQFNVVVDLVILSQQRLRFLRQFLLHALHLPGQLILFIQHRYTTALCFQGNNLVMSFQAPGFVHFKAVIPLLDLTLQRGLFLSTVHIGALLDLQCPLGFLVIQYLPMHPVIRVGFTGFTGLIQNFQRLDDGAGFLFHSMNGFHQIRHSTNGFAKILFLQDFIGHKFVDTFYRLVGHEIGKGTGRMLCFPIRYGIFAPTQQTI